MRKRDTGYKTFSLLKIISNSYGSGSKLFKRKFKVLGLKTWGLVASVLIVGLDVEVSIGTIWVFPLLLYTDLGVLALALTLVCLGEAP